MEKWRAEGPVGKRQFWIEDDTDMFIDEAGGPIRLYFSPARSHYITYPTLEAAKVAYLIARSAEI